MQLPKFFNGISEYAQQTLEENSELVVYKLGQPLCIPEIIPNKIIIILEGETRLLGLNNNKAITIAKLGSGSFIGLSSILKVKACESVTAIGEVKAIVIPDNIILNLYNEDESFRDFCSNTIFPAEVLDLANYLTSKSTRTDISIISAFNVLFKSSKLITCINNEILSIPKSLIAIATSSNIINVSYFSILEKQKSIEIRPPFKGRFLAIPIHLHKEFTQNNNNNNNSINVQENNKEKETNLTLGSLPLESSLNLGEERISKSELLIRANGELRETIACLQMISKIMNLPFRRDSIEKILRDEIRNDKKVSLNLCGGLLNMLGLHVVGAKIPTEQAIRIPHPSLIKWNDGFALIHKSSEKGLTIASPKDGWIKLSPEDISNVFSDFIEFITFDRTSSTPNKKFGLEWFWPSLKKHKNSLLQVLLASFVVQLFTLANPLLIQVIIDKVISQRSLDTLQVLGIGLVIVTILGGIIGSLRTFLFTETTNRIDTRLGSEVIDHLLRVPLKYFDKRPVGELGSRVAELEKIRNFLTGQALTTIIDAAFSVIYIVVLVLYSWLLTLIALGVLPIQIGLTLIGSPLLRRQIRETAAENAKTQSHLVEVLTGIQTVKAQNIETVSRWKWQEFYVKYISRTFEKTITGTALGQISDVLQKLSQLLVLWVGAALVLDGKLTLGQLIAFRIISGFVTQPLLRLSSIWQNIQELRVSFERLADIIDTPEESNSDDKNQIPLPSIIGKVQFENVEFSFDQKRKVLNSVRLEIPAGEFVGIVGQSGSGKSTLMKLLPRLYEINEGTIKIDNYDINKVELYSLRRQIGIVPQDPLLFSGKVSENIAITNPDADADEIVLAAKTAAAHDFIMDLPSGYSTNVGERGASLSGGQRQRIAIARTLMSKPKMLILDEATSALDYQTERIVCENLRKVCKGSTVFFITHRLSTIKNADKIIMMHDGNICEKGTHTELMELRGRYYALYRQQESNI